MKTRHQVWLSPQRFEWLAAVARRVPLSSSARGELMQPRFEFKGVIYFKDWR